MKAIPKISKYMTTTPHSIGSDQPIKKAMDLMHQHQIRHLPVQEGGKLVGILTDRDLRLAGAFEGSENTRVSDVMLPDPYICTPETELSTVAAQMAEKKLGSALIEQNGKLVGIFTAVDGMRVLHDIIEQNYKHV